MQELVTYIIITASVSYVIFKVLKLFIKKESDSGCVSTGCSGCSSQSGCSIQPNNLLTDKSTVKAQ